MEVQIAYAKEIESGSVKHISEVKNGLACNCVCVECGAPLIAANGGESQEHHFKHEKKSDCKGSLETELHLISKQIFKQNTSVCLSNGETFNYYTVVTENDLENEELKTLVPGALPDLLLKNQEDLWIVEIAVTSFCTTDKIKKYKQANYNTLEIDLSKVDRSIKPEELKVILIDQINQKKVLTRKLDKQKDNGSNYFIYIFLAVVSFLGITWLCRKLSKK